MLHNISILILLSLMISACWEKQSHEITRPEPANYQLNGIVKDIDLDESLDSIKVKISTALLLETDISFSKTTFTDEQGKFSFDTLYVGAYQMRFYRNGYEALNKRYFQNYYDSTMTFYLPDVYYIPGSKIFAIHSGFSDSAIFSFHPEEPYVIFVKNPSSSLPDTVIYRHKWDREKQLWIQIQKYSKITDINIRDDKICIGKTPNYFYLLNKIKQLLYKIQLTATYLKEEERYTLPHFGNDIYYAGEKIYISAFNRIYIYDKLSFTLERELTPSRPDIYITSFCINTPYIWLSDNEADLLYQCDNELKVLKTYVPYYVHGIFHIYEMSYDYTGKDWYGKFN
ncbi:MAG: carboxypeptidase regulatory-like domain-containing protein [Candidatus Marinimicrobia bacterium]|nr:carboxypeptidase regulatory-like domain-containing protein [Candidatus Neomarinimicrobiota bacterium]